MKHPNSREAQRQRITFSSRSDLVMRISSAYPISLSLFNPLPSLSVIFHMHTVRSSETVTRNSSLTVIRICGERKSMQIGKTNCHKDVAYFVDGRAVPDMLGPFARLGQREFHRSDRAVGRTREQHPPVVRQHHWRHHSLVRLDLTQNLRVWYLFQFSIRTDSKRGFAIGSDSDACVGAAFVDQFAQALARVRIPFVDGTVHAARDNLRVVSWPQNVLDFTVVAFEVHEVLEGDGGVDLDHVAVDSDKEVASMAERALKTRRGKISVKKTCRKNRNLPLDILG